MCCCGTPVVNGEMGYKWQPTDKPSVREPNPPSLRDRDVLLYDEPGRCGGLDSHCHHLRVVRHCGLALLVRHGGGEVRLRLQSVLEPALAALDSTSRYWALLSIYHAHNDALRAGKQDADARWETAAAEGRIRTRKQRGSNAVRVWIEDRPS